MVSSLKATCQLNLILLEVKHRIVFVEWHKQCNYTILLIFLSLPLTLSRFFPSPCFQTPTHCVLILTRETKTFVHEMFKRGGPSLFPVNFNFYIQRYLQRKYVATPIWPFSGNEWEVFLKETFRP